MSNQQTRTSQPTVPIGTPPLNPESQILRDRMKNGFESQEAPAPTVGEIASRIRVGAEVQIAALGQRLKDVQQKLLKATEVYRRLPGHLPIPNPPPRDPNQPPERSPKEIKGIDDPRQKWEQSIMHIFMQNTANLSEIQNIIKSGSFESRVILLEYIIRYLNHHSDHPVIKVLNQNKDLVVGLIAAITQGINIDLQDNQFELLNGLAGELAELQVGAQTMIDAHELVDFLELLTEVFNARDNPENYQESVIIALLNSNLNIAQVDGLKRFLQLYPNIQTPFANVSPALEYAFSSITANFATLDLVRTNPTIERRVQEYLDIFVSLSKQLDPLASIWQPYKVEVTRVFNLYLLGDRKDPVHKIFRTDPIEFAVAAVENENIWELLNDKNKENLSRILYTRSAERDYRAALLLHAFASERYDTFEADMEQLYILRPQPPFDTDEKIEELIDDLIYMYLDAEQEKVALKINAKDLQISLSNFINNIIYNFYEKEGVAYPEFEDRVELYKRTERFKNDLSVEDLPDTQVKVLEELMNTNDAMLINSLRPKITQCIDKLVTIVTPWNNSDLLLNFYRVIYGFRDIQQAAGLDVITIQNETVTARSVGTYIEIIGKKKDKKEFIHSIEIISTYSNLWEYLGPNIREQIYKILIVTIAEADLVTIVQVFKVPFEQIHGAIGDSVVIHGLIEFLDGNVDEKAKLIRALGKYLRMLDNPNPQRDPKYVAFIKAFLKDGNIDSIKTDLKLLIDEIKSGTSQQDLDLAIKESADSENATLVTLKTGLEQGNVRGTGPIGTPQTSTLTDIKNLFKRIRTNDVNIAIRFNSLKKVEGVITHIDSYVFAESAKVKGDFNQMLAEVLATLEKTARGKKNIFDFYNQSDLDALYEAEKIILQVLGNEQLFSALDSTLKFRLFNHLYNALSKERTDYNLSQKSIDDKLRKELKEDRQTGYSLILKIYKDRNTRFAYAYPYILEFFAQKDSNGTNEFIKLFKSLKKDTKSFDVHRHIISKWRAMDGFINNIQTLGATDPGLRANYNEVKRDIDSARASTAPAPTSPTPAPPPPGTNRVPNTPTPLNPAGTNIFERFNLNEYDIDTYVENLGIAILPPDELNNLMNFINCMIYEYATTHLETERHLLKDAELTDLIGGLVYRAQVGIEGGNPNDAQRMQQISINALQQFFASIPKEMQDTIIHALNAIANPAISPEAGSEDFIEKYRNLLGSHTNLTGLIRTLRSIPPYNPPSP